MFIWAVGDGYEKEIVLMRRRLFRPYVPALVMALALLYLALPSVQPSAAEMIARSVTFETTQPVTREELEVTRDLLEQRISFLLGAESLPGDGHLAMITKGDRLVVSRLPGIEPSMVVAEASRIGLVEVVDGGTQFLPIGDKVKTGPYAIPDQDVYQVVLTGADFVLADPRLGDKGRPVIQFALTPAGDARLAAHTAQLRGYYLCLAVDDHVVNCPILRTPLVDRQGVIELTGDATLDDARTLARLLRFGPLPAPLKLVGD